MPGSGRFASFTFPFFPSSRLKITQFRVAEPCTAQDNPVSPWAGGGSTKETPPAAAASRHLSQHPCPWHGRRVSSNPATSQSGSTNDTVSHGHTLWQPVPRGKLPLSADPTAGFFFMCVQQNLPHLSRESSCSCLVVLVWGLVSTVSAGGAGSGPRTCVPQKRTCRGNPSGSRAPARSGEFRLVLQCFGRMSCKIRDPYHRGGVHDK